MKKQRRQSGLTLTELLVTITIAAVLMGVAVPAARRLAESMQTSAGARGMIAAALSNARAIAVREQKYAGVRFQRAADDRTYMVFIEHEYLPSPGIADRFVAVSGRKPIALPEGARLNNNGISDPEKISVIFSPSGRLVIRPVRTQRKGSRDNIFNEVNGANNQALFVQDGEKIESVNRFEMWNKNEPDMVTTLMVSPYTGELIGE